MTNFASRNDSLGFAERCKKNLLHIEHAHQAGFDIHVVTQIILSTVGLIVFPWERNADQQIRGTLVSTLNAPQWPEWVETRPSKGLGQLIHNLRNAIVHRNFDFSSDDRSASNVIITFRSEDGNWEATISAQDLNRFCLAFIKLIEDSIG
jgi:hypothetical protein